MSPKINKIKNIKDELEELSHEVLEIEAEVEKIKVSDDSVHLYLKAIGKIPLLNAEEEIKIARNIKSTEPLIAKKAINKLIQANLRLVVAIAKRYSRASIPLLDIVQDGNTGLMKAAHKFDAELGYRFSTYATWWIKQSIARGIQEKERSIKIPSHAVDQINKLKKVVNQFVEENGRTPTNEEIDKSLPSKSQAHQVALWKELEHDIMSLEAPINKDNEGNLGDIISDLEEKTPEYTLQQMYLKQDLYKALQKLDFDERKILEMKFGFNQEEKFYTWEEISEIFNISKEKVKGLEFRALRKIKHLLGESFKDYL